MVAMAIWTDIQKALSPGSDDMAFATRLVEAVEAGLPLANTQTSLLKASDAAMASFYAMLESRRQPLAPRSSRPDTSWMLSSDFCWLNVRACAIDNLPGTFIRAAKILPAITSQSILLAPFHPIQFDLNYAPETMTIVEPALIDVALKAAGISPENQLRALVSACGLLGKGIGYELLPYVSQFSRIAMEKPRLFRWVALDEERTGLAHADPAFPYRAEDRLRDAEFVADIAARIKEDFGIASFRKHEDDCLETLAAKDKAYYSAIKACVDSGLWPVPAHARSGIGIPSFLRRDDGRDFPVFSYRDADGLDIGEDAYSVVAPFAFYDDIPPNALPANPLHRNEEAIDYYSNVFSYWRDSFGFDFVRYNAVDRVFEEALDDDGRVPSSDRPTAEVIQAAIRASRDGAPGVGALASRKGSETQSYGKLGFDLTMGTEALRRMDSNLLTEAFALYDALASREPSERPASACFSVDVPESGAPRLWGSSLSRIMGPERMRLRHGMSRFLSVGKGRRPLFETMGFQDGSTGLYESGLSTKGLDWADDALFASGYAAIERLYASMRPFIDSAFIAERFVDNGYAWWQIRGQGRTRLLVVAVSLETAEGFAPGHLSIPLDPAWGELEGRAYRLPDCKGLGLAAAKSLELDLGFLDMVVVDLAPAFY